MHCKIHLQFATTLYIPALSIQATVPLLPRWVPCSQNLSLYLHLCPLIHQFSIWHLERTFKNVTQTINIPLVRHFSVFQLHLGNNPYFFLWFRKRVHTYIFWFAMASCIIIRSAPFHSQKCSSLSNIKYSYPNYKALLA